MARAGGCGADFAEGAASQGSGQGSGATGKPPLAALLFGEDQARYLVTTGDAGGLLAAAERAGVPARTIRRTGPKGAHARLILAAGEAISLAHLRPGPEGSLPGSRRRRSGANDAHTEWTLTTRRHGR